MKRIRYSVAASLDGYIAGPNGEYDWILMDPDINFEEMFSQFDTLIMGRKSYEVMRTQGDGGVFDMDTYVFSSTLQQADCIGATVVSDNVKETLTTLKGNPGKDIWLFGGGELFRSLLELTMVDTVEVAIIPIVLGRGIPLLPDSETPAELKLTKHVVYEKTGTIFLEYSVIYQKQRETSS